MGEERLTREEWQRVQAREECAREGHDFETVIEGGTGIPVKILCSRCGRSWDVES